ncbi:MAG: hypothetical protein RIR62_1604 [Pseudomonadota bacterium]|jgi:uridine kinase
MTHPVIAISGIPGAGKTTLAGALAQRLGARHLCFDAYETLTLAPPEAVAGWLSRGAPLEEMYDPRLDAELARMAGQGPVVFDTPLGRLPAAHARLVTCAIWIDVPRDVGLARKLALQTGMGGWDSAGELADWLCGYLAAYERVILPSLKVQAARVMPLSDHVIDGMTPPDAVEAQVWRIVGPRDLDKLAPKIGQADEGRGQV